MCSNNRIQMCFRILLLLGVLILFGSGTFLIISTHSYLENDTVLCYVNDTSVCHGDPSNNTITTAINSSNTSILKLETEEAIGVTFRFNDNDNNNHDYVGYVPYRDCYCQSECCQTEFNDHDQMTCFLQKNNIKHNNENKNNKMSPTIDLVITGYSEIFNPFQLAFFAGLAVDILIFLGFLIFIVLYVVRKYNRDKYRLLVNNI